MSSRFFFNRFWSRFGADVWFCEQQKLITSRCFCERKVTFALFEKVRFLHLFGGRVWVILALYVVQKTLVMQSWGGLAEPFWVRLGASWGHFVTWFGSKMQHDFKHFLKLILESFRSRFLALWAPKVDQIILFLSVKRKVHTFWKSNVLNPIWDANWDQHASHMERNRMPRGAKNDVKQL